MVNKQLTITNLGTKKSGKKSFFVRRTSSGIDYYHNYDDSGLYREALRTVVESKPRMDRNKRYVLKLPLEIGTEWREISRPLLLLRIYPFRVRVGKDGQGSFKTYTDAVTGEKEIPMFVEEWYAPGVGLIKQIRRELDGDMIDIFNTPIFIGGNSVLELKSFKN